MAIVPAQTGIIYNYSGYGYTANAAVNGTTVLATPNTTMAWQPYGNYPSTATNTATISGTVWPGSSYVTGTYVNVWPSPEEYLPADTPPEDRVALDLANFGDGYDEKCRTAVKLAEGLADRPQEAKSPPLLT